MIIATCFDLAFQFCFYIRFFVLGTGWGGVGVCVCVCVCVCVGEGGYAGGGGYAGLGPDKTIYLTKPILIQNKLKIFDKQCPAYN